MLSLSQLLILPALLLLHFLLSSTFTNFSVRGVSWSKEATKWPHNVARLNDVELQMIAKVTSDYEDFNKTLEAILIPRVPGTPGHQLVKNYIVTEMQQLGWAVEDDSFTDRTPHGQKPFTNIIANLNPDACRFLTIACHYDSMYNREYTFLGATDSAVPCAMMIHAAKMLNEPLKQQRLNNYDLTLQFIFFDGEEAFKRWSNTDSLYGSRHLAAKWDRMAPFPSGLNDGKHCKSKQYASYLDRMEVMVLLDLIGSAGPKFYSYFPDTLGLYTNFVDIESRLGNLQLTEGQPPQSTTKYFESRTKLAIIEDDHIPFMKRGVPIVHVIPTPFPHVWHKESDNLSNVHHPTVDNLNKILRAFIAQYLHLKLDSIGMLEMK